MTKPVVAVRVLRMWESCQRTTYFVELLNTAGQRITPESHVTGSLYTNMEGLSVEEARDRALISADTWATYFGLTCDPYSEDGVAFQPSMRFHTYDDED